jgi:hypothetical protein
MYRLIPVSALLVMLAAVLIAGCAEDDTPTAPTDPPVAITDQFPAPDQPPLTLTPHGGVTHPFVVQRAGDVTVRIDVLEPAEAVIGISLGPLSAQACSAIIARDNATVGQSILGTATTTGSFCVRVYDAGGTLTAPVAYRISVQHF